MFIRIYSGEDGQSHFEKRELPTGPGGWSSMEAATGISFHHIKPGRFNDWHHAPRRQYVIAVSGELELRIGDGTVQRLGRGDVLLAEDLTGQGHTTRVVSSETWVSVAIPLA